MGQQQSLNGIQTLEALLKNKHGRLKTLFVFSSKTKLQWKQRDKIKKKKKGGHAEMSSWQGNVSKNLEGGKKTNKLTLI